MGSVELTATDSGVITSVAYSEKTELPPMALVGVNDALADVPVGAEWKNKSEYKFTHVLPADEIKKADTLIEILRWMAARLDAGGGSMNPDNVERGEWEIEESKRKDAERLAAREAAEDEAYGDDDAKPGPEQTASEDGAAAKPDSQQAGSAGGAAFEGAAKPSPEGYIHGALTELWRSQESIIKEWSEDPEGLEEQWAQLFSELFSGINYDGCGEGYVMGDSAPRFWDEYIYSRLQSQLLEPASYKNNSGVTVGCSIESWENPVLRVIPQKDYDSRTYEENPDPASPMCCACQYLATFGLITRGFRIELKAKQLRTIPTVVGLSAAPAQGVPVFTSPGGWAWRDDMTAIRSVEALTNPKAPKPKDGDDEPPVTPPAITPGTVFTYHKYHQLVNRPMEFEVMPPGASHVKRIQDRLEKVAGRTLKGAKKLADSIKAEEQAKLKAAIDAGTLPQGTGLVKIPVGLVGQPGGSHIMHVLRIHPSKKKVQLFDSNGGHESRLAMDSEKDAEGRSAGRGLVLEPGMGINMDTCAFTLIPGENDPNGIGVPRPAPDLPGQIEAMRKARPIGLARLVLTERKPIADLLPEHVLFVSKLMRTYGDAEHQNYTITRYLWSLRNTPGFSSIQPFWLIFLPRGILARAMWAVGSRAAKLGDFVEAHRKICEDWLVERKTKQGEAQRKENEKAKKEKRPPVQVVLPLDWRDLGADGGYQIDTNYRDAQILTNLDDKDFPGRARVARNVCSSPVFKTGGATLEERGMRLPRAFTQPLPEVAGDRNIILPARSTSADGAVFRASNRILAWDFVYVRDDIDGADRLRKLEEPGLEYFETG